MSVPFTLTGTGSGYVSVLWSQVSGAVCTIDNPTSLVTTGTAPDIGVYVFKLTGTNCCGINESQVTITVQAAPPVGNFDISWVVTTGGGGTPIHAQSPANFAITGQPSLPAQDIFIQNSITPDLVISNSSFSNGILTVKCNSGNGLISWDSSTFSGVVTVTGTVPGSNQGVSVDLSISRGGSIYFGQGFVFTIPGSCVISPSVPSSVSIAAGQTVIFNFDAGTGTCHGYTGTTSAIGKFTNLKVTAV